MNVYWGASTDSEGEMNTKFKNLYKEWKYEEKIAHIQGWDFLYISKRYVEEDNLPWDFKFIIKSYLTDNMKLLDMETGGGGIFA